MERSNFSTRENLEQSAPSLHSYSTSHVLYLQLQRPQPYASQQNHLQSERYEGVLTALGLLAMTRLLSMIRHVTLEPTPFGNECHIGKGICFYALFLHFKMLRNRLEGLNVLIMWHTNFKAPLMFIFIRNSANHIQYPFLFRDISLNSFKISQHAAHGSKIFRDTTARVDSVLHPF